jgi:predicted DNA-binding transcriptional regulator AlpA
VSRRPRTINVRDIAGAGEVDRYLMREAGISRPTAVRWRARPDFPRRAKVLRNGPVWDLAEIRTWLRGAR